MTRALLFAIACMFACRREESIRQVVTIRAVDDGAVVVWRDKQGNKVSLLDAQARPIWSATVYGGLETWSRTDDALVIGGGRISLRTHVVEEDGVYAQIESFALRDGARWRAPLGVSEEQGDMGRMHGLVANDRLYEAAVSRARDASWLVALDLASGREIWRAALPFEADQALARGSDVVVRGKLGDAIVTQNGEVHEVAGREFDHGCVADGRYWRLVGDDGAYELVTTDQPTMRIAIDLPEQGSLDYCARAGDGLAFLIMRGFLKELWIVRGDGRVAGHFDDVNLVPTQRVGVLPRFVPAPRWNDYGKLALLDTMEMHVRWERSFSSIPVPRLAGDRWYIATGSNAGVVVIDGGTGTLLTAKQIVNDGDMYAPDAINTRGVWMQHESWTPTSQPMAAKLDPLSLEQVAGFPVKVVPGITSNW